MSKAAKTCSECGGSGREMLNDKHCVLCSGTGIVTTGQVVNATGHDGCIRGLERANATIAEQAAEIERLKERYAALEAERDTLRSALEIPAARSDSQNASIAYFEQESASHDAALKEVTTERDQLRLEAQRLKDLNFEAQDRYAALEAERDELKTANATLRMINESVDNRCEENRARAEKYLAVIRAKDTELVAVHKCWEAAIKSTAAMSAAGLPIAAFVPSEEEADHG